MPCRGLLIFTHPRWPLGVYRDLITVTNGVMAQSSILTVVPSERFPLNILVKTSLKFYKL